ncbi:hypothetical protein V6Z11_A05G288300 [Gossypium hirsutum]
MLCICACLPFEEPNLGVGSLKEDVQALKVRLVHQSNLLIY